MRTINLRHGGRSRVEYHDELGYPREVVIDYAPVVADKEYRAIIEWVTFKWPRD